MDTEDLTPDCGRIQGELAAYLYSELALDTREVVERHLAGCAGCRDELAVLRDTRRLLARWETPAAGEDPRALARTIAAQARGPLPAAPPAPRRARLLRWSAVLSGAAAALLFTLGVLNTQVSVEGGRLELGFALPGAAPAPAAATGWEERMRTIAAQEVAQRSAHLEQSQEELFQRVSLMTQQELLRLSQAVDFALAQNQRTFDSRLTTLGNETKRADIETRRALSEVASYVQKDR